MIKDSEPQIGASLALLFIDASFVPTLGIFPAKPSKIFSVSFGNGLVFRHFTDFQPHFPGINFHYIFRFFYFVQNETSFSRDST
jgi:hypothetical protein